MKAFAYLRVSGRGQLMVTASPGSCWPSRSTPRQTATRSCACSVRRRCPAPRISLIGLPGARSVGEILADGVKVIVIERLDRLARDLMVQEHLVADCQK